MGFEPVFNVAFEVDLLTFCGSCSCDLDTFVEYLEVDLMLVEELEREEFDVPVKLAAGVQPNKKTLTKKNPKVFKLFLFIFYFFKTNFLNN